MSLNRNIVANYASQTFVVGVGIGVTPLYLKLMGPEAYGLVGFFAVMQTWFGLLDLGLTPTIARETARYHGGGLSSLAYRQLFRALSLIFVAIAFIGATGIWLAAETIAGHWLKFDALEQLKVEYAVTLIGAGVAVRWMSGLYRGVVSGAERLIWLSAFSVLVAAGRFLGVFASMHVFGYTPLVFFVHQLAVNLLEVAALSCKAHSLMPASAQLPAAIGWSMNPVRRMLRFSMTIALTSAMWIVVTQSDRLILSGVLSLREYGYFTLAVLVAGGITMITSPISVAITPRLARLHFEGSTRKFYTVYKDATRLVTAVAGSAAVTLAVCAEQALWAWTGDLELASTAAPILRLYAIGNALLALAGFPFYIQYARGALKLHIIGNLLLAAFLLPAAIFAATKFGAIGAAWVWVAVNLLYFGVWVAYVHHVLAPGLHLQWLLDDIARILVPLLVCGLILSWVTPTISTRFWSLAFCLFAAGILAAGAAAAYRYGRQPTDSSSTPVI